jgi:hypothetical protein
MMPDLRVHDRAICAFTMAGIRTVVRAAVVSAALADNAVHPEASGRRGAARVVSLARRG